jgi:hypothetical protein
MAALADLQPDRRAVLQLLIGRGRGYDQIAELLQLSEIVVRRRAHDAITTLAGGPGDVSPEQRALLCDYLVGELPASRRAEARKLLADDAGARRFARAAAARLSSIEGAQLPELPAEDEEVAEALDALDKRRERQVELEQSSKRGAWLLIAGIAVVVVVAVVVLSLVAGGGDGNPDNTISDGSQVSQSTPASTSTTPALTFGTELKAPAGSKGSGEIALRPNANGATSLAAQASGLVPLQVNADGSFTAWAVWLEGANADPLRLGFYSTTTSADALKAAKQGKLDLGTILDGTDSPTVSATDLEKKYDTILITRETLKTEKDLPSKPGTVVLSGKLKLIANG